MSYPTSPRQSLAFWSTFKEMAAKGACSASVQGRAPTKHSRPSKQEAEAKQQYWGRIVYRSWPPPAPSRDRVA